MNILQDHTTTIASLANISILLDMKPTTYNARTVEWKTYAFTIRYNVKAK